MGWRARNFYEIKNKKEIVSGHTVHLVWGEKALSWLTVGSWLTEQTGSGKAQPFTGTQRFLKLLFADVAPWAGAAPSWA